MVFERTEVFCGAAFFCSLPKLCFLNSLIGTGIILHGSQKHIGIQITLSEPFNTVEVKNYSGRSLSKRRNEVKDGPKRAGPYTGTVSGADEGSPPAVL